MKSDSQLDFALMESQDWSMKIVRRILWSIYAWPITLLLLGASFFAGYHHSGTIITFAVLDFLISFPSIVAMHLHIWDKRLLNPTFWKTYTFVFYAWDLSFNLLIQPTITGEKFDPYSLIVPIILIPFYVALFRYAFRQWNEKSF
jgi:general stress protein CsbA